MDNLTPKTAVTCYISQLIIPYSTSYGLVWKRVGIMLGKSIVANNLEELKYDVNGNFSSKKARLQ